MITRKSMSRRAFTVVEIVFGASLALMVAGGAIGLAGRALGSVQRASVRLDGREAALFAMARVRDALTDAWNYGTTTDGRLRFFTPRGGGELSFDAVHGRLLLRAPGERTAEDVVGVPVTAFATTAIRPGLVRLRLELPRKGGSPLTVTHDVQLPAIDQRDPALPWRPVLEYPASMGLVRAGR